MPNIRKLTLAVVLALLPAVSFAGGAVTGGATLPEQIMQEGTAVSSLAKQAQEVVTQIEQYENMVQNMVQIPQSLMSQIQGSVDPCADRRSSSESGDVGSEPRVTVRADEFRIDECCQCSAVCAVLLTDLTELESSKR